MTSTVIHGDTAIVQYGIGTFGSRGLAVGGVAVHMAMQKLKDKAHKIAAHMLQCEKATFVDGKFCASMAKPKAKWLRRRCRWDKRPRALCQSRTPAEKL